jgi:hypothetical protein
MRTRNIIGTCCTNGGGYWSTVVADVDIISLDLASLDADSILESSFGELRAYFTLMSWNPDKNGLIYTDPLWLEEFRALLRKMGFSSRATEAVEYSEQGMQGVDYVSMDVGDPFIVECDKFLNFVEGNKPLKAEIKVSAFE